MLRQTAGGWTPALWEDGAPVRAVGLDPARSQAGAEADAMQLAGAEPEAVFAVVDDAGAELFRTDVACPF